MQLDAWMDANEMSNREMAEQIGMKPATVWKLRQGEVRPSLAIAVAIEKATHGRVKPRDWIDRPAKSPD